MKKILFFVLFLFSFASSFSEVIYLQHSSIFNRPSQAEFFKETIALLKKEAVAYDVTIEEFDESQTPKYPYIKFSKDNIFSVANLSFDIFENDKKSYHIPFLFFPCGYGVYYDDYNVPQDKNRTPEGTVSEIIVILKRYFHLKNSKYVQKKAPVFIDRFVISDYYGKEIDRGENKDFYVAGKNDFSFIVKDGNSLCEFDSFCNYNKDYFKVLDLNKKLLNSNWIPVSPNGKEVFVCSENEKLVYIFNENGIREKKIQKDFPADTEYTEFHMSKSGNPYFVSKVKERGDTFLNEYYQEKIIFSGDEFCEKFVFPKIVNEHSSYFIGNNDEVWTELCSYYAEDNSSKIPYNYFFIYDKNGVIKKIVSESRKKINEFLEKYNRSRYGINSNCESSLLYVFDDDSFLTRRNILVDRNIVATFLACCYPDGDEKWSLEIPVFMNNLTLADYKNGIYYFVNQKSGEIFRFAESESSIPDFMKSISEPSNKLLQNEKDYEQYLKIAEIYDSIGGYWQAFENYKKYLKYCPADSKIKEKCFLAEVNLLKINAKEYAENFYKVYEEYGEETARDEYSKTMKILEKLKKQVPWDTDVLSLFNDLKSIYSPNLEKIENEKVSALNIDSIVMDAIFPALLNTYISKPTGSLKLKNVSSKSVKNISVSTFVRKYMDFPTQNEVIAELNPKKEYTIPVKTIFNNSILDLDEDINVQVQYTIEWEEEGKKQKTVVNRPATIYKKSAMSWKDTSMLSCFILPNDKTVSTFAFNSISENSNNELKIFSKNFCNAMLIANSLGSLPLKYIPDPVSPTTDMIGNEYAIDSVRFPQNTLYLKGGDCDDMTTLYCSLLESAGIKTALITTPGHIFMAFDSGLKSNFIFENMNFDFSVINHNGKIWIPIEITILNTGFENAWKKASQEINENVEEFIILSDARSKYPPIYVTDSAKSISVKSSKLSLMSKDSIEDIKNKFLPYLDSYKNDKNVKNLNVLAKMYFLLGFKEQSIETLKNCISIDKNYLPAYLNLSKMFKEEGDVAKLIEIESKIKALRNDSDVKLANAKNVQTRASDFEEVEWSE